MVEEDIAMNLEEMQNVLKRIAEEWGIKWDEVGKKKQIHFV